MSRVHQVLFIILACQVPDQVVGMSIGNIRGTHMNLESQMTPSTNKTTTFEEFTKMYGRTYKPGTPEYEQRRAWFEISSAYVMHHNSKSNRHWTATINKFADRTTDEFKTLRGWDATARPKGMSAPSILYSSEAETNGKNNNDGEEAGLAAAAALSDSAQSKPEEKASSDPKVAETVLPECVSWADLESMRDEYIPDQAAGGSCWAFAAAKTLQAHSEVYQHFRTFSAEQIVSCTKSPEHCSGNGGCHGATAELAFEYVLGVGLETQEEVARVGAEKMCKADKYRDNGPYSSSSVLDGSEMYSISDAGTAKVGGASFGMTGWMKLAENSLLAIKQALVQHGPVAVGVDAGYGWNFYSSGILTQEDCPADANINHAVTLVGYGKEGSDKYWRILNSWGADWGEGGFVRIMRSDTEDDYCGYMGITSETDNDSVKVCGMCGILYDASLPVFAGEGAAAKAAAVHSCK